MGYVCVDRGTEKCPCVLMETGQCYTCGMISTGKCDCASSWQGVCPYTEYIQNGRKTATRGIERNFKIAAVEDFSDKLKVMTLETSMGFALECSKLGAFLMIDSDGYKVPLSVMEAKTGKYSYVKAAMYVEGPKTELLDRRLEKDNKIKVTGPFVSGVIHKEQFDIKRLTVIIGKGIAIMPVLNQKNVIGGSLIRMYLDESKLTREFIDKYVLPLEYKKIALDKELESLSVTVREDVEYSIKHTGKAPNIFLMVSPYYKTLLMEKCRFEEPQIIYPNHANMCCGEGVCGACSHTDENGHTVRLCKCIDE